MLIHLFEVEQAILSASRTRSSPLYERITELLVFPVKHDTLGQDVAVALVSPSGSLRVDLRKLHSALRLTSLAKPKWPNLIVYVEKLPQIEGHHAFQRFTRKLGLATLGNETLFAQRHWEVPPSTHEGRAAARLCDIQLGELQNAAQSVIPSSAHAHVWDSPEDGMFKLFIAPSSADVGAFDHSCARHVESYIALYLHDYLIPSKIHLLPDPLPEKEDGSVDEHVLSRKVSRLHEVPHEEPYQPTHFRVRDAFAKSLSCEHDDINDDVGFLDMGGDLIKAEHLLSSLRVQFEVDIPPDLIVNEGTVNSVSAFINTELRKENRMDAMEGCT